MTTCPVTLTNMYTTARKRMPQRPNAKSPEGLNSNLSPMNESLGISHISHLGDLHGCGHSWEVVVSWIWVCVPTGVPNTWLLPFGFPFNQGETAPSNKGRATHCALSGHPTRLATGAAACAARAAGCQESNRHRAPHGQIGWAKGFKESCCLQFPKQIGRKWTAGFSPGPFPTVPFWAPIFDPQSILLKPRGKSMS